MQDAYEFLNEKLRCEKGENNYFLGNSIKDNIAFYTDIYYDTNNKDIFTCSYIKKVLKNVYAFFLKLLATAKQLIRRNSIFCLKNKEIFYRVSIVIGLNPPIPLFVFIRSLRTPLSPPQQTLHKKSSLEEIEGVNDNASAFMHLNIKINK